MYMNIDTYRCVLTFAHACTFASVTYGVGLGVSSSPICHPSTAKVIHAGAFRLTFSQSVIQSLS